MPLKMRPTGLGHGAYEDDIDYSAFCGEWCIGSGRQRRGHGGCLGSNAGRGQKAEFEASWKLLEGVGGDGRNGLTGAMWDKALVGPLRFGAGAAVQRQPTCSFSTKNSQNRSS
jgi:hypothetical protein